MEHISYLQASVIALLQGVTELFPVSSLGHSVLVPALIGGSWKALVTQSSTGDSGKSVYLTFIVALHVATALALLWFYRRDWVRIIGAFLTSLRDRRIETSSQRLAWLLVVATVPVGITGLTLEHTLRTLFAKPEAAALFLTVNGLILLGGERLRRRSAAVTDARPTAERTGTAAAGAAPTAAPAAAPSGVTTGGPADRDPVDRDPAHRDPADGGPARPLDSLGFGEAAVIGLFQTLALLAGISRSGVTLVGGLVRGLDHEDAARFAFLLATPIILAAGVLKAPGLVGATGRHIHGQVVVGMVLAAAASYLTVRFLTRYFTTRTLTPFGIYCLVAGVFCAVRFA